MGCASSKEPPKRLTDTPWREPSNWDEQLQKKLLGEIERINLKVKPSLLFVGPVRAGKSSFINSILSISKGHKVDRAYTGDTDSSYTKCYDKYTEGTLLKNFRLRDCMGIEQNDEGGVHQNDIVALLKGHVKDGYKFNSQRPISESSEYYQKNPNFKQQTHCVVFVVDSQNVHAGIPPDYVRKIRALHEEVKKLRIPRVLILTKTDELCPEVEKDSAKMFRSILVKNAVAVASEIFNIPPASIHPVKNYEESFEIDMKTNIPLLLALRQMMQYAVVRVETFFNVDDTCDSDSDDYDCDSDD